MSGALVARVVEQVLVPLTAGGELRPVPPIGEGPAVAALADAVQAGDALGEARARRLRVARRLAVVDAIGDPGQGEWLMIFAFNDLLQSMNETLPGPFGHDRPHKLLEMALRNVERAGVPANVGEALSRHATFSRLLDVTRIDTEVRWWVGRRVFRGAHPPPRLLAWRSVRRVSVRETSLSLGEMGPATEEALPAFEAALRCLLAASPLTDLANAGRTALPFRWTGAALSLVCVPAGRLLALRALERVRSPKVALDALRALPEPIARSATPEAARANLVIGELCAELERRWETTARARAAS